jgi:hypothetical protein
MTFTNSPAPLRSKESGNVLFLILIAVALFAALSYAVTQSTRSGGGSTEREQSLLGSATLTQYPTTLRSSVTRMILGGADVRNIMFNAPADFDAVSSGENVLLVFHPDGGGAVFQDASADVMANAAPGKWVFNAELEVPEVGRDGPGGNDLIAFLVGVNQPVCERINEELGFVDESNGDCDDYEGRRVPSVELADTSLTRNMTDGYDFPTEPAETLQCGGGTAFNGVASGCFHDGSIAWGDGETGAFVYYAVLLER